MVGAASSRRWTLRGLSRVHWLGERLAARRDISGVAVGADADSKAARLTGHLFVAGLAVAQPQTA